MNFQTTTKTRRCPIAMNMDLESAKQANAQLAELTREKSADETQQLVIDQLHLSLEMALGGVARPARGFLPEGFRPATGRPESQKGWQFEIDKASSHEQRMSTIQDPEKLKAFVGQFGLGHEPILNNRHEKRAWAKISRTR